MKRQIETTALPGGGFAPDWVLVDCLPPNADLKGADNTLRLSLVNIEEEKIGKAQQNLRPMPSSVNPTHYANINPEIKLNLYILASAYFTRYEEALKRIAYVIRVFQRKYVFEKADIDAFGINSSAPELNRVILDLYSQTLDQQYQFGQSYGRQHIPSVMYKARIVTIDEAFELTKPVPAIAEGEIKIEIEREPVDNTNIW